MKLLLLIESDHDAATNILEVLTDAKDGPFEVEWVNTLNVGIDRLTKGGVKLVLLNLSLSDSKSIDTLNKLDLIKCHVPILIFSDLDQEDIARQAVQRGAHDYIMKGHINSHTLSRVIYSIMQRTIAEEELFLEKERAQVTLNSIADAVISTDNLSNITYLNVVAERLTGWPRADAIGRPLSDVFKVVDEITRKSISIQADMETPGKDANGIIGRVMIRRNGVDIAIENSSAPIRDRAGRVSGAVIVFHDVSQARAMALKMSHLAQHDSLTDLPNRLLLNDRLTQAISQARRHHKKLAVMFMDMDRFKNINDSMGHSIGDKLLQSVAKRLVKCVRSSDTVCRQGGDEFVVLLAEIEDATAATHSAIKILAALVEEYNIEDHKLSITSSIGISVYPDDGEDSETLLKNADAAMYHAKEKGRNNYQLFKQGMNDRIIERKSLEKA